MGNLIDGANNQSLTYETINGANLMSGKLLDGKSIVNNQLIMISWWPINGWWSTDGYEELLKPVK